MRLGRTAVGFLVAGGLILLVAANWHLVYVAIASAPDCVSHVRPGQSNAESGVFSAAKSSCSPR